MAVPALQYTPISARRGRFVHATDLRSPGLTACRRRCDGWVISARRLDCPACKRAVFFPVTATARARP